MEKVHVIKGNHVFLNSECAYRCVVLYDGTKSSPLRKKQDIASLCFDGLLHEGLERIDLCIGGCAIMRFDAEDIEPGKNMLDPTAPPLPISKASFMVSSLKFWFRKDYLEARESYAMVDEEYEEVVSDDESEFVLPGGEVALGRRLHRKSYKTGNMIRVIVEDVAVSLPDVRLGLCEGTPSNAAVLYPVWQKTTLNPTNDDECEGIIRMLSKHESYCIDDSVKSVEDALARREPITCRIKNIVRFQDNMAGMCYLFN